MSNIITQALLIIGYFMWQMVYLLEKNNAGLDSGVKKVISYLMHFDAVIFFVAHFDVTTAWMSGSAIWYEVVVYLVTLLVYGGYVGLKIKDMLE